MRMPLTLCGLTMEKRNIKKPIPINKKLDAPFAGKNPAMACAPKDLSDRNEERRFTKNLFAYGFVKIKYYSTSLPQHNFIF